MDPAFREKFIFPFAVGAGIAYYIRWNSPPDKETRIGNMARFAPTLFYIFGGTVATVGYNLAF